LEEESRHYYCYLTVTWKNLPNDPENEEVEEAAVEGVL
jgi:hypothetical protein